MSADKKSKKVEPLTHYVQLIDSGEIVGRLSLEGYLGEEKILQVKLIPIEISTDKTAI